MGGSRSGCAPTFCEEKKKLATFFWLIGHLWPTDSSAPINGKVQLFTRVGHLRVFGTVFPKPTVKTEEDGPAHLPVHLQTATTGSSARAGLWPLRNA